MLNLLANVLGCQNCASPRQEVNIEKLPSEEEVNDIQSHSKMRASRSGDRNYHLNGLGTKMSIGLADWAERSPTVAAKGVKSWALCDGRESVSDGREFLRLLCVTDESLCLTDENF